MSQHDFNIANQSFPATRTDLNNALVALASNSSGDAEPATKYANQWWYKTDTNTLKLRNEANDAWISIAVLDQSGNAVQSITTAGLTLGSTAISATGAEINQLDAITRGSILYGNASGATARLAKGGANTFLKSDGTDIAWSTVSSSAAAVVFPSNWASPTNNYTSSGTWSKGSLADDDYVWFYLVNSGGGGGNQRPGFGGMAMLLYGTAAVFNGAAYTIGAAKAGQNSALGTIQNPTTVTLSSGNGSLAFTPEEISDANDTSGVPTLQTNIRSINAGGVIGTYLTGFPAASYTIQTGTLPSGFGKWTVSNGYQTFSGYDGDCVFGGGVGFTTIGSANAAAVSLFAGNGGASLGAAPAAPGGGGAQGDGTTGATGAAGSLRVYHV